MNSIQHSIVTLIIVTYNSEDEIIDCLESIFKNKIPCIVYVVDNASSDHTVAMLREYSEKEPRVKVILNSENKGLAYANNQPIPFIESKYTLILNPDILLRENTLELMVEAMENDPSIGMLGPLCVFADGERHLSAHSYYNVFTILTWRLIPHTLMRFLSDKFSNYNRREVLFVSGACYIIPSALYKELKGYDPALFLTVADVADIGVRVKEKKYKVIYHPDVVITHFSNAKIKTDVDSSEKLRIQFWGLTGDLYFIRKHKGQFQASFLESILMGSSFLRAIIYSAVSLFSSRGEFKGKAELYYNLTKSLRAYPEKNNA